MRRNGTDFSPCIARGFHLHGESFMIDELPKEAIEQTDIVEIRLLLTGNEARALENVARRQGLTVAEAARWAIRRATRLEVEDCWTWVKDFTVAFQSVAKVQGLAAAAAEPCCRHGESCVRVTIANSIVHVPWRQTNPAILAQELAEQQTGVCALSGLRGNR
jgi:hypothetical protein